MNLTVSIIVPVYNGEKTLHLCLESLSNIDYPKDNLEIIVVDNNSIDNTKSIISQYHVRYVFESKRGRAAARNRGIKESRGEIIAFTDADCIVDKLWIKNLIKGFTSDIIGGCGGEIFSYKPQTLIEKYTASKNINLQKTSFIRHNMLPGVGTGNAAYRLEAIEEVGLFDNFFIAQEDIDLSLRVFLKGYQLVYVPEAVVYHKHRSRFIDFLKQRLQYGEFDFYLHQKYINIVNRSSFSYNDLIEFFYKQFNSLKNIFINMFRGKDLLDKIFPIFDMMKNMMLFIGKFYGLLKLRLGIVKISPLSNQEKLLWKMTKDEAVIFKPQKDFYYVLDELGTRVWSLLRENKNPSDITKIIADEYKTDKKKVKNNIINFIDELKKEELILK